MKQGPIGMFAIGVPNDLHLLNTDEIGLRRGESEVPVPELVAVT